MIRALSPAAFSRTSIGFDKPVRADLPLESQSVGSTKGERPPADPTRVPPNEPSAEVDPEEQQEIEKLKKRDAEVRQHEQAHTSAGGAYAGAPRYSYETGPDGKRYVTSGEVPIDTSEVRGNPRATVAKLETVVRAALAPVSPSGQDQRVASSARAKLARVRAEMRQEAVAEEDIEGQRGIAARAAKAYSPPSAPSGNLTMIACENCGSGHA